MKYIVCKFKDDGLMFITTRQSRETMLNVLLDLGQEVESVVVKECETYQEAINYKASIEQVDKTIDNL